MKWQRLSMGLLVAGMGFSAVACGPGYLTADEVRAHLDNPSGQVASGTLGRVTDDFMKGQQASAAHLLSGSARSSGGNSASGALSGAMGDAVLGGVAGDLSDAVCATGVIVSFSQSAKDFEKCEDRTEAVCEARLEIDSCLMRLSDEGADERARGRIVMTIRTEDTAELQKVDTSITFEDWLYTDSPTTTHLLAGALVLSATDYADDSFHELIMSADLRSKVERFETGMFENGVLFDERVSVATRFLDKQDGDTRKTSLELLAFVDEDVNARNESVAVSLEATEREIDADTTLAGATLSVRGSNGAFTCTWGGAERVVADGVQYTSNGTCIDEETGEEFTWDSEAQGRS